MGLLKFLMGVAAPDEQEGLKVAGWLKGRWDAKKAREKAERERAEAEEKDTEKAIHDVFGGDDEEDKG